MILISAWREGATKPRRNTTPATIGAVNDGRSNDRANNMRCRSVPLIRGAHHVAVSGKIICPVDATLPADWIHPQK
jgi:hypothetical protein